MANDPLVSSSELETWLRMDPGSLEGDPFVTALLGAVSILVRDAGSIYWTAEPDPIAPSIAVPDRAKLIAVLKAKTYYENPQQLVSETTGPITERRPDELVHNMTLTETEQEILAKLAGIPAPGAETGGLWVQPISLDGSQVDVDDVFVTDQSGSDWMIPWVQIGDNLYPAET